MGGLNNFQQRIRDYTAIAASLTLSIGLTTTVCAADLPPGDTYTIHGLYSFEAHAADLNDFGITVGRGSVRGNGDDFSHAGKWDETGTFTDLDPNFLNDSSFAAGINNQGDVVGTFSGFANQLSGPVLFRQGSIIPLPDQNGVEDPAGRALDINDNGLIVGCTNNVPVVWNNSVMAETIAGTPDGATGCAMTANNQGDVVGYITLNSNTHAALWRNGRMIDLGVLPGHEYSIAVGINELG